MGVAAMASRLTALTLTLLCLAACTDTTTFTSTWKDPGAQPITPVGKTVAAVFVTQNVSQRRAAEDTMAADLRARGATAIPSYTVMQDYGGKTDADAAGTQLKKAGAQAVVIMRVVGKDQQVTYTPGTAYPAYYGGFGPYWGYSWGTVYDPGYLRTDTMVSVETLIYSLNSGKLLWASTSRTTNPQNVDGLVKEVADATAKEMAKQGLLAP
jgi:hypothetical protein